MDFLSTTTTVVDNTSFEKDMYRVKKLESKGVTIAKKAKIHDNAIKALVGHKQTDITESAYTERDIEWLREDIEKLT